MIDRTLANAVLMWNEAKAREDAAAADRKAAAEVIAALLPSDKAEGTLAVQVKDYKVTVARSVNRKVDADELGKIWQDLLPATQRCFKWNAEPKMRELRGLMDFSATEYAKVAPCITAKPATPSVKVELLEQKAAA